MNKETVPGSFRDPSGFVFQRHNVFYRQVNQVYASSYEKLISSGLYDALQKRRLLISHEEVDVPPPAPDVCFKVLKPTQLAFISHPYEWSFSQLKDAALATLRIQTIALEHGMSLKDSSAYNIQFHAGRPVLIDTLSFEEYREGSPWVAYRQFCQHFLAPLALIAYKDVELGKLLQLYVDGIPLPLASKLLPRSTWLKPSLLTHLHLHARSQQRYEGKQIKTQRKVSKFGMLGIVQNLRSCVRKLTWVNPGTTWGDYYGDTNYSDSAFEDKKQIIESFLDSLKPSTVWDLGSNTGLFSRLATARNISTISLDGDPAAVEANYLQSKQEKDSLLLPVLLDLTNPSPSIGWMNVERDSLFRRGPAEVLMALALIHHLAIGNNVPLPSLVDFFYLLCHTLIIEFVPKEDSQIQRMLATREDVFPDYNQETFEREFGRRFSLIETRKIAGSSRVLYLMRRTAI